MADVLGIIQRICHDSLWLLGWAKVLKNNQAFEGSGYLGYLVCFFNSCIYHITWLVTPLFFLKNACHRFQQKTTKNTAFPPLNPPKQNNKNEWSSHIGTALAHRNHLRNPLTPTSPIPAFAPASGTLVTTESDGRWCRGFHRRSIHRWSFRCSRGRGRGCWSLDATSGLVAGCWLES